MSAPFTTTQSFGPPGKPRPIGLQILLFVVTIGFYAFYWAYKTHDEIQIHSRHGVGGVLGLVIWILITPVSAFLIPNEIATMHDLRGRPKPVTGWTGLWLFPFGILIIPAIVWFVQIQGSLNRYWEAEGVPAA